MELETTTITASLLTALVSVQNDSADALFAPSIILRHFFAPPAISTETTYLDASLLLKGFSHELFSNDEKTGASQDKRPKLAVKTLGSSTPGRSDRSSRSRRD